MRSDRFLVPMAIVVAAATVTTVSGCGPATVAPGKWSAEVCQSLAPWRAQITSLNATAQAEMATATTPQETRTHLLALLDGARKATGKARADVQAAGVPDVEGGAVIEKRFVASLDEAAKAYAHAYASVSALSMEDADTFYAGVASAMTTLNTEYGASGVNAEELISPELQADFDKVAGCR